MTGIDHGPTTPVALIALTLADNTILRAYEPLVRTEAPVTKALTYTWVLLDRFTSYFEAPLTVDHEIVTRFCESLAARTPEGAVKVA